MRLKRIKFILIGEFFLWNGIWFQCTELKEGRMFYRYGTKTHKGRKERYSMGVNSCLLVLTEQRKIYGKWLNRKK